jgi:hypothetical protein
MKPIYIKLREQAKRIAAKFKHPEFYTQFAAECALSKRIFFADKTIIRCRKFLESILVNDFGHGMVHAKKVALDAGALIGVEASALFDSRKALEHGVMTAQLAALLHDTKRGEKNHAQKGAEAAHLILKDYSLTTTEMEDIVLAIANHEAFTEPVPSTHPFGQTLSDILHDADKFRWGMDNLTETVWLIYSYSGRPLEDLVAHFPEGMKGVAKIRETFRSETGKQYGPEFIDIGLGIGKEIYQYLKQDGFVKSP